MRWGISVSLPCMHACCVAEATHHAATALISHGLIRPPCFRISAGTSLWMDQRRRSSRSQVLIPP